MDTRVLGKPDYFSGKQEAWRDWTLVFTAFCGAVSERLERIMQSSAYAQEPTLLEDLPPEDRRLSVQLSYMLTLLLRGTALNEVRNCTELRKRSAVRVSCAWLRSPAPMGVCGAPGAAARGVSSARRAARRALATTPSFNRSGRASAWRNSLRPRRIDSPIALAPFGLCAAASRRRCRVDHLAPPRATVAVCRALACS